jgi:hypothetical protein
LNLLSPQFDEGNVRLFHDVLISSFFCVNNHFYELTDGDAMGSPLSPVIANISTEESGVAISRTPYKPTCWFHYVDDIRDLASWTKRDE